jgi:hypothetical protein
MTIPYDDRLITCPECRSTFEAEDGSVVHQGDEFWLRQRIEAIVSTIGSEGCDCGHNVWMHSNDGCVGGLMLCACRRQQKSIIKDRLRAALDLCPIGDK